MTSLDKFVVITPKEFSNYTDAKIISSHCMVFARLPGVMHLAGEDVTPHGAVMMQIRFDGKLGFAGGLIDENESPESAVNREMVEEINLDLTCHKVEPKDYVITYYNKSGDSVHHFYALEVTFSELKIIEQRSLSAKEYGDEVLGILRVPLYTREDGLTGFPTFLTNQFAGCSYLQLMAGLETTKLLTAEELEAAKTIALKI